jgi:hypothetical protein
MFICEPEIGLMGARELEIGIMGPELGFIED